MLIAFFNAFACRIMLLQGGIELQNYVDHFTQRYVFISFLGYVKMRKRLHKY